MSIFAPELRRLVDFVENRAPFDQSVGKRGIRMTDQRNLTFAADEIVVGEIRFKIWNVLSADLKLSPSIASFKERSKRDLLGPYGSFVCSVPGCFSCAVRP